MQSIAKVDLSTVTLGGGNILFAHSDTNLTSSTDPNDTLLNVTLIDNARVVPERGALAITALAGLAIVSCGRRRR